ncbi:tripartite tricarboxylate transporter substrate binding protein [Cupriavidus sp. CV2]|uniref:Bug family tripartite tricarboxylate transporter substrate binding protein n=1 Tax=Cupriavidus ulmosensis TaxID=3065913 RepID=UPI00296AF28D|nr:tripartite tricarboxylate transporter substrate binding protein [Cupriavidus sp. CV2]MDW3683667.1 tripartite tricarboxylate transporter substrate binding protein [Cupriavidus sp. CV2]
MTSFARHPLATLAGAILAVAAWMPSAHAAWPERPVRLIVPTAPGGSPDLLSRLLGNELSKRLGQPVVIENRPGASGNIGMQALFAATPDGYTIAYGNNATLATNRALYGKLPYDPDKLVPVIGLVTTVNLLVVTPALPVKSIPELIDYARKHPGELSMGSAGNGTTGHLSGELFKTLTGVQIMHVPYKGSAPAIQDLLGNNVQLMFDNIPSIGPSVRADKVRALAVTSLKRSPHFPHVPTLDEAGVRGYEMTAWSGLVAAPGTPAEVIARLNREVNEILKEPAFRAQLDKLSFEPLGGTPQQFQALISSETRKFAEVVRKSGARID